MNYRTTNPASIKIQKTYIQCDINLKVTIIKWQKNESKRKSLFKFTQVLLSELICSNKYLLLICWFLLIGDYIYWLFTTMACLSPPSVSFKWLLSSLSFFLSSLLSLMFSTRETQWFDYMLWLFPHHESLPVSPFPSTGQQEYTELQVKYLL